MQTGDTEYILLMEEKIRECLPADFGVGVTQDGRYRFPAIILRESLRDKGLYENADIKTLWEAAHFRNIGMEKVFLNVNFSGERSLKFYINLYDPNFVMIKEVWFSLIIETNGMIAISDKREPSIIATNVPIDVPKLILEHIRKRKEEWKEV